MVALTAMSLPEPIAKFAYVHYFDCEPNDIVSAELTELRKKAFAIERELEVGASEEDEVTLTAAYESVLAEIDGSLVKECEWTRKNYGLNIRSLCNSDVQGEVTHHPF